MAIRAMTVMHENPVKTHTEDTINDPESIVESLSMQRVAVVE